MPACTYYHGGSIEGLKSRSFWILFNSVLGGFGLTSIIWSIFEVTFSFLFSAGYGGVAATVFWKIQLVNMRAINTHEIYVREMHHWFLSTSLRTMEVSRFGILPFVTRYAWCNLSMRECIVSSSYFPQHSARNLTLQRGFVGLRRCQHYVLVRVCSGGQWAGYQSVAASLLLVLAALGGVADSNWESSQISTFLLRQFDLNIHYEWMIVQKLWFFEIAFHHTKIGCMDKCKQLRTNTRTMMILGHSSTTRQDRSGPRL